MRYVLSCRNKVAVNSNEINTKGEKMKAVVFDMDGVIFDSETLVFRMWKVVAEKSRDRSPALSSSFHLQY